MPMNELPGIALQPEHIGDAEGRRAAAHFYVSTSTATARFSARYVAIRSKSVALPPGMRAAALANVASTLSRPRANGPNGLPQVSHPDQRAEPRSRCQSPFTFASVALPMNARVASRSNIIRKS